MERILVIGSPGSGKTNLSKFLAKKLHLPLVHLDREYWRTGWVKATEAEWCKQAAELTDRSHWIMDGEYLEDGGAQLSRAQTVIWLDLPRALCLSRALRRVLRHYRQERPDLAEGCPEYFNGDYLKFMTFIWTYPSRVRPKIQAALASLRPDQQAIVLGSTREVAAFLSSVPDRLKAA